MNGRQKTEDGNKGINGSRMADNGNRKQGVRSRKPKAGSRKAESSVPASPVQPQAPLAPPPESGLLPPAPDTRPPSSAFPHPSSDTRKKLVVEDLVKTYQGKCVVDRVNLEVTEGQIVGLLGPNGAGKSTTFYSVVGIIRPDSGAVYLNGENIIGQPMYLRARKGITYLSQEPSIFRKLTVEQNLMAILETLSIGKEERRTRLQELLGDLKIAHLAKNKADRLSGGERRRVEITRALVTQPSFILLDEPFAGIDPLAVIELQGLIRALKAKCIGVLISDHNVRETLKVCDWAYIMHEGRILEKGAPTHIAESDLARRTYLGDQFCL
jgi:lipopolysaccharide export system ATP-binding protein